MLTAPEMLYNELSAKFAAGEEIKLRTGGDDYRARIVPRGWETSSEEFGPHPLLGVIGLRGASDSKAAQFAFWGTFPEEFGPQPLLIVWQNGGPGKPRVCMHFAYIIEANRPEVGLFAEIVKLAHELANQVSRP